MIEVEHTVEIDRPADEVFEYLTDVSRLPEWQSSAASAELDGDLREGALVREVRTFIGRRAASTLEVTEYVPPRRFSLRVVETHGIPRLMQGAVRRAVERQFVKDLEALKRKLESGPSRRDWRNGPRRRGAMGGARQGRRERSYPVDTGATEDAASRRPARPGGTAPVSPSPPRARRP